MDAAAFRALVQRLEQSAAHRPGTYRFHVIALAALGYVYVFAVLVLLVGLTVGLVIVGRTFVIKLVIPLLALIAVVLRSLWVTVPTPQGDRLTATDAPKLFELLREVRIRLKAPRVHVVLTMPALNAAVVQQPRLGIFGRYRNYLLVGLPLLQALSADEWRAVLAHEMGHLSARHGRFGAWIYRVRETWTRLQQALQAKQSAIGQFLFGGFFAWYAPYFNAYTFVVARAHEYEADAAAAELVGAETARRALLRLEVADRVADGFWTDIKRGAAQAADPPADVFQRLAIALRAGGSGAAAEWVSRAWERPTNYSDTHPALADRLKALGWRGVGGAPPPPPGPLQAPDAATVFLGSSEQKIEQTYDQHWVQGIATAWKAHHAELSASQTRLAALDARAPAILSAEEEMERIAACGVLEDYERARSLGEALLQRVPNHAGAHYYLGQALLFDGDARGVAHIEISMRQDPEMILPGCNMLFRYYWGRGETEQADRYRESAGRRQAALRDAEQERRTITKDVKVEPHQWTDEQVATLTASLKQFPAIREAYLARRIVRALPEYPCYILGIVPRRTFWNSGKKNLELRRAVASGSKTEHVILVFLLSSRLGQVRRQFAKVAGARLI